MRGQKLGNGSLGVKISSGKVQRGVEKHQPFARRILGYQPSPFPASPAGRADQHQSQC